MRADVTVAARGGARPKSFERRRLEEIEADQKRREQDGREQNPPDQRFVLEALSQVQFLGDENDFREGQGLEDREPLMMNDMLVRQNDRLVQAENAEQQPDIGEYDKKLARLRENPVLDAMGLLLGHVPPLLWNSAEGRALIANIISCRASPARDLCAYCLRPRHILRPVDVEERIERLHAPQRHRLAMAADEGRHRADVFFHQRVAQGAPQRHRPQRHRVMRAALGGSDGNLGVGRLAGARPASPPDPAG